MSAAMQQIAGLSDQLAQLAGTVDQLKNLIDQFTPKFGHYDEVLSGNMAWRNTVEGLMNARNAEQVKQPIGWTTCTKRQTTA